MQSAAALEVDRALRRCAALADPQIDDANDAALQALDLRRVARIIGTPLFGPNKRFRFVLRRVARIFGTTRAASMMTRDVRILRNAQA